MPTKKPKKVDVFNSTDIIAIYLDGKLIYWSSEPPRIDWAFEQCGVAVEQETVNTSLDALVHKKGKGVPTNLDDLYVLLRKAKNEG